MALGFGVNIVTDGLIFYTNARNRRSYSGSGTTWRDLSKNKFHGVLQNSPTWNYNSFILDGTNDKVEFPLVTSARANVTMQGWVYVQLNKKGTMFRMGGGGNGYAIGQGNTNFDSYGNQLVVLFPAVRWAPTSYYFSTPGWYFVTLALDGSSVPKVYVNNQYIGSYSGSIPAVPTANFYIGSNYGDNEASRYFDGQVSSCLVYNRELTIDEISQNYFATKNQYEKQILLNSNLVSYLDAAIYDSYPGTGTTWTDLAGNSNGTLVNSPTFNMGADGNLIFNGTNQYVDLGSNVNTRFTSGSYTISMWFKTASGSVQMLISHGDGGYALYLNNYVPWYAKARTVNDGSSGYTVPSNTWTNITVINNIGSNVIYYINGAYITTRSFTAVPSYSKNLRIGHTDSEGYYFNGSVSNCLIYNRALTSDEIYQSFNAVRGRFGL